MPGHIAVKRQRKGIGESVSDRVFNAVILMIVAVIWAVILYPLYFIVIASFSDPVIVSSGKILLHPEGIMWEGYKNILGNQRIWTGYRNTILYVLCGTAVSLSVTILAAYALSRKDLPGRNIFMGIFLFTMYFSGGLIPTYLTVRQLNLVDKPIVIVLLGAFSVYNMIIARTYFATSIPLEMQEAAFIDGCSNQTLFVRIVLPLSKPILAVIALYFAVGQWNAFFNALIYLNNNSYYPLQLVLRGILLEASAFSQSAPTMGQSGQYATQQLAEVIKYGVIVVSTLPIIIVYPFLQKYFVKGVMIGAVKG